MWMRKESLFKQRTGLIACPHERRLSVEQGTRRNIKVRIGVWAVVFLLAAVGVTLYVQQYYLSMRDAKPVLEMLERGTLGDFGAVLNTLLDGPRLREPGSGKIRQAVLRALASTSDGERLDYLFGIILAGQDDGRLLFKGKTQWDIIKAATDRSNANSWQGTTYSVLTDTNGGNWLNFQNPPIP
jgi:hypothetical protein